MTPGRAAARPRAPQAPLAAADGALGADWEALGTSVALRVNEADALARARAAVKAELDAIDHACSRFRADSELTRANASAGCPVVVSELLLDAVELALRAARVTGGAVDPTVGRALQLAGYDRDWQLLVAETASSAEQRRDTAGSSRAPAGEAIMVRRRPGWHAVVIDRIRSRVQVPRGVSLDLGATAKGWAADRAARAAALAGDCGALVAIGGDVGTAGMPPPEGWRIHITDDHRSPLTAPGQTVRISSGGLASSSVTVRRWRHAGRAMHHIIDPRTGAPAETPWRTVSVAAASCAEANIASTAAIVKAGAAAEWLASHQLPARLVARDGRVRRVGEWPEQGAAL